ncbi:osiris 10a [Musca autumnalis]|uniref:osiris 10a n=1 Tax=Musca autumnalis TaxID=221902 RepID=UPI003CE72016
MKNINERFITRQQISTFVIIFGAITSCLANSPTNKSENLQEFKYCLKNSKQPRITECIGRSAISFLQRFDERDNVTLTMDLVATKSDNVASRSLVNFLDTDPVDMRGILENAGAVFSQRSLEWHMDAIYPGLMLKIGPSADRNSVAEFVIDPTIDERNFNIEDASTARILTKQYVLPFLLGLKFNLVALVPVLFTIICLLLKKSLFIVKLVIYISSLLGVGGVAGTISSLGGWGSLFAPPPPIAAGVPYPHQHHGGHFPGSFGFAPGKQTAFSHAEQDEFQHLGPYKRQDRKVVFEKPRDNDNNSNNNKIIDDELVGSTLAPALTTPPLDNFYNFEKQMLLHDRSGRMRHGAGKLGPSAYDEDYDDIPPGVINVSSNHRFKTSNDNSGWKIVRV